MLPPGWHSQQAGTMISTLMLTPPAMPPCRSLPRRNDQALRFIRSAMLRNRLGSQAFHWFQS